MELKTLKISNFRNIRQGEFTFSPAVNIFSGSNAQGKTNLVEALTVALNKSFRKSTAQQLQRFGSEEPLSLELGFICDKFPDKENLLKTSVKNQRVYSEINGIDAKSAKELYTGLKYVLFIPEDLYLIKGNPEQRRDYIDGVADSMNQIHHAHLNSYNKALKQKNTFLSRLEGKLTESQQMQLEIWNQQLAKLGVNVMCGRLKYFDTLSKIAAEYYNELSNGGEKLTMSYNSTIAENYVEKSAEEILRLYMEKLENYRDRETAARHSLVGVQRDDVSFYLDGKNARDFASQGQIRSIALSLRLAQAKMLTERHSERPVIILDDVLSELDGFRRSFVLNHIVNYQLFITGCNINDFTEIKNGKNWQVSDGIFTEIYS